MEFTLSEEDQLLQQTCRQYAVEQLLPDYGRWKEEPFPRERVRALGDLGVLGIRVPLEHGGAGGSYVSLGVAAEELSRGDFNVSYFLQLGTISAELLAGADDDLRAEWLPRVASGDAVLSFGLTEPGVGSDAANLTATAHRDGGDWVLNGEKASITFAGMADACIVFAPVDQDPAGSARCSCPSTRPGCPGRCTPAPAGTSASGARCSSTTSGCRPASRSARKAWASSTP